MIWQRLLGRTQSALRGLLNTPTSSLHSGNAGSVLDLAELEDRILMSATPLTPDAMPGGDHAVAVDSHGDHIDTAHLPAVTDTAEPIDHHDQPPADPDAVVDWTNPDAAVIDHHEVVIVDTSIDGYQELIDQIEADHDGSTHLDIIELDNNSDGVEQITHALEQYDHVDAVHILSHGADASVRLGNVWLNADRLNAYAGDIAHWGDALSPNADVMLYACNLASTADGRAFVEGLSALTGADVAASTDVTGHASLGGDWNLEFSTGAIEASTLLSHDSQTLWHHVLPTEDVYDGFESHDYTGNSGTVNWSDAWHEVGESDGALLGNVHITHHDLDAAGSHCLEIDAVADRGIYREVDLSSASSATLHFDYQAHETSGFNGSSLVVLVSDNGGTSWTTLATYTPGTDSTIHSIDLDLSSQLAAHSQIQFLSASSGSGSVYVDHVDVTYEVAPLPPPNTAPELHDPGSLSLTSILEDAFNNTGNTVDQILASGGSGVVVDPDVGAMHGIAVTHVDDTHGLWQYDADGNGSWQTFGAVTDSSAVLLSATSRVRYIPTADYNGSNGQIEFRAWDQTSGTVGSTGVDASTTGGETAFSSSTGTAGITVDAVNDQPHVTLPGAQSAVEDTSLDIHGLSVSDVDSDDGGELAVTLTVQHGTLGLTDTTGLTFTGGTAPGDASLTFTGTVDHVNAALATLAYQSDLDYNGADSLDVNVSDQGNTGSGGVLVDGGAVAINIAAVNDQPHVTLPGAQSAVEDTSLDIHGLSVSDVDSDDGGELAVTLTVQHGTLGLTDTTGLTFTGGTAPGDASLTFTGTVDHVNAALATLAYQSDLDYNGADSLDVNVSDQGNTGSGGVLVDGGAVAINIAAVNDQPHVTLPGAQSAVEDTSLDIHGLSVSDVDSDDGGELAVTLTVQHGTLGLTDTTGLTFTGGTAPGDASLTFTGTVDHVNAALATLAYQGDLDYNGADSLDVNVSDQGNTGSGGVLVDGGAVAINIAAVNDQPHVILPGAQSAVEDTSLDIHGLSVSDVDSDDGGELAVTLTVQHGTLGLTDTTGLTFTGGTAPGDASLTFTGTVDHVNAALATLAYQGDLDYNGADSLDVNVSDQGNTGSGGVLVDGGAVAINIAAVNDQPHVTLPGAQSAVEDTSLDIHGLSVSDVDSDDGGELAVTLTVQHGTLGLTDTTGLTFTGGTAPGDASLTFTGTVDHVNAALATLAYQGDLDYNGADSLDVNVSDQGNTGSGGVLVDGGAVAINIAAVNDQPHVTLPERRTPWKIPVSTSTDCRSVTWTPMTVESWPSRSPSSTGRSD